MNLTELQSVQARERQSDSLQELRPTFYRDAADFVADLREERARVAADADDPFESPEVTRLTDDIRTAERTIEAVYERRVGKVVKLASLSASEMPAEEEGLTTEERELYETLVGVIEGNRAEVLAPFEEDGGTDASSTPDTGRSASDRQGSEEVASDGSANDRPATEARVAAGGDDVVGPAGPTATGPDPGDGAPAGTDRVDGGGAGDGPSTRAPDDDGRADGEAATNDGPAGAASTGRETERTTVRITEDVGAILGVDEREYDLAAEDVVTLPAENAAPLIERDAAEPVE